MAAELVRYRNGKPALEDGLTEDDLQLICDSCNAEYRVHYSAGEVNRINGIEDLRSRGRGIVNQSHPQHLDTLGV